MIPMVKTMMIILLFFESLTRKKLALMKCVMSSKINKPIRILVNMRKKVKKSRMLTKKWNKENFPKEMLNKNYGFFVLASFS